MPDDGDPWAPNNLLKPGAKEKHQLNKRIYVSLSSSLSGSTYMPRTADCSADALDPLVDLYAIILDDFCFACSVIH